MFVGPLEATKITFVVSYNHGYRRMKAYADLHTYLGVYSFDFHDNVQTGAEASLLAV